MQAFKNCVTEQDYIKAYKELVDEHGVKALSRKWLIEQGMRNSYEYALHKFKLSGQSLADKFEIWDQFKSHQNHLKSLAPKFTKWTEESLHAKSLMLIEEFACIPPVEWLQANQLGGFDEAIRDRFGGISQWRLRYNLTNDKKLLVSRYGLVHLSLAEVCFANYLWARKIEVFLGGRYPKEYQKFSGKALGKYDLEFIATSDEFFGKKIFVEIFGGPRTKDLVRQKDYEKTKNSKIKFHQNHKNNLFFWIDYKDCYSEEKVSAALAAFIKQKEAILHLTDYDKIFSSVTLSVADYVMTKCRSIVQKTNDGIMPGTNWLLKVKPYESREVYEWEDSSWASLCHYIDVVGGIRKVREALGLANQNVVQWSQKMIIQKVADFYIDKRRWPITIFNQIHSKSPEDRDEYEILIMNFTKRLNSAIERYFDNYMTVYQRACDLIPENLRPTIKQLRNAPQKWFPDVVINKLAEFYIEFGEWPGSTYNRLKRMKDFLLQDQYDTYLETHRLNDVIQKNFGSFAEAYNKARDLIPEPNRPKLSKISRALPVGVCDTPNGKYRAGIRQNGKNVDLGTHDDINAAANAYQEALLRKRKGLQVK